MKLYVDDWLSSAEIALMSDAEERAYMRLLMWQWKTGVVPDDPVKIARILGRGEGEAARIWAALRHLFPNGQNEKCANVRAEQEARAKKGRRGAEARWNAQRDAKPDAQPYAQRDAKPDAPAMGAQGSGLRAQEPGAQDSGRKPRAGARARQTAPAVDNSTAAGSSGSAKPRRASGRRRPPSGPQQEVIAYWLEKWSATRPTKYAVLAKCGKAVKECLKLADGELFEVTRRIDALLESKDPWMAQNASLSLLLSQWNPLGVSVDRASAKLAAKADWRNDPNVEIVE